MLIHTGRVESLEVGGEPLFAACAQGHHEVVHTLIKKHPQVVNQRLKSYTPLMMASAHGHVRTMQVLM